MFQIVNFKLYEEQETQEGRGISHKNIAIFFLHLVIASMWPTSQWENPIAGTLSSDFIFLARNPQSLFQIKSKPHSWSSKDEGKSRESALRLGNTHLEQLQCQCVWDSPPSRSPVTQSLTENETLRKTKWDGGRESERERETYYKQIS